ncbi:U1 small nuclear ribonucleoprotein C [Auxenochlorella protothecoides]|uniref:U1 small nuclear ribonucleoprotein C n=1 Tax=Auxenochlorella protothecoides TaxID=3075 RepID=A0A087SAQ6_AUXPR|nr:U1 small nuclear ribonucleoprotein C [Auxenochlorella protothecoides]KFM22810.1 U1 small nuclear ribonucleoprotein C [Auxenochlorella protothecoides]
MPRYYCDYCDAYLTHDSPVVGKQHNSGYKHKANVKSYFTQFEETMQQRQLEAQIRARMVGGLGCVLAVHA